MKGLPFAFPLNYALAEGSFMETEITKKLFTADEYHRMAAAGILGPEDRVELIDGEIVEMSAVGSRHIASVIRGTALLTEAFGRSAMISPQNPVQLSDWTEPQPDLAVLKSRPDFYASQTPMASDVLLAIEVSDTTLNYDRTVKVPHYAAARILEIWIEDLQNDCLLVFRDPQSGSYKTTFTLKRGDRIHPLAFPDIEFTVNDLLGDPGKPS